MNCSTLPGAWLPLLRITRQSRSSLLEWTPNIAGTMRGCTRSCQDWPSRPSTRRSGSSMTGTQAGRAWLTRNSCCTTSERSRRRGHRMTMRVADYVWKTVADRGVRHVFMITGGGAMFLNDALGREKRISYVCNHHEQACAIAAEAYARVSGQIGVVSVTTGPGGVNALTGVFGAWTDSIPMLVISGQVKRETCMAFYDLPN